MIGTIAALLLLFILSPSLALAQTCVTATPNGSGTTYQVPAGTSWSAIQSTVNGLVAGDNLLFQRGAVFETTAKLNITRDGNAVDKIKIGAYGSGANPIIDGSGAASTVFYGIHFNGANHVIWDGVDLRNMRHGQAVTIEDNSNFITFRRSKIDGSRLACIKIAFGSDDATIEFNEIYRCGDGGSYGEAIYVATDPVNACQFNSSCPCDNASAAQSNPACEDINLRPTIRGNTIINNRSELIEFKPGTRDGLIEHNYLEGGNNGILVSHWAGTGLQNGHVIRNNLIHNKTGSSSVYGMAIRSGAEIHNNVVRDVAGTSRPGIWIHDTSGTGQTITAHHNTVYNASGSGICDGGGANVSFASNLVWASGNGSCVAETLNFGSNPLFQNPAAFDFRLQAGSPAGGFGAYAIGAPLIPVGHTACIGEEAEIEIPPGTEIVADYQWDNAATDASVVENDCTGTGTAFSASSPIKGTHSLLLDASTDVMTCPNVGHTPTQGTIRTLVRVDNCTGATSQAGHYIYGETTIPATANRKQIYLAEVGGDCTLNFGWGADHFTLANVATLAPATDYHVAATWDGVNLRAYLSEIGVSAPVEIGTSSYTGLTAKPTTYAWGNIGNPATNAGALRGRLDESVVVNRALTAAEVVDDYNALHGEVEPPPAEPTLVPFEFTSGTIGPGGNNVIRMTMPDPDPDAYDPEECLNLSRFTLTYADAPIQLSNCSLVGLQATFTAATAVPNNQIVARMYRDKDGPDEQNILLVNTATTPQPPIVGIEQAPLWRWPMPGFAEGTRWRHPEGTPLKIPSPSPVIIARVAIVNNDDATAVDPQSYGLWCAEGKYPTVAGTLTTALTGANNDLLWTAKDRGAEGNGITVSYLDPGEETTSESIVVTDLAIAITLRSVSSVLSTADQVKTALLADGPASALVLAEDVAANDGSGVVTAMSATALSGGVGDVAVRLTTSTADFPLAYHSIGDAARTENAPTTEVAGFTLPDGIAFQAGGTVQQAPSTAIQPQIEPNSAVVFEPIFQLRNGEARGKTFGCCMRAEPDGRDLDVCSPLELIVGATTAR